MAAHHLAAALLCSAPQPGPLKSSPNFGRLSRRRQAKTRRADARMAPERPGRCQIDLQLYRRAGSRSGWTPACRYRKLCRGTACRTPL